MSQVHRPPMRMYPNTSQQISDQLIYDLFPAGYGCVEVGSVLLDSLTFDGFGELWGAKYV